MPDDLIARLDPDRRETLKNLLNSAFVAPMVVSFAVGGFAASPALAANSAVPQTGVDGSTNSNTNNYLTARAANSSAVLAGHTPAGAQGAAGPAFAPRAANSGGVSGGYNPSSSSVFGGKSGAQVSNGASYANGQSGAGGRNPSVPTLEEGFAVATAAAMVGAGLMAMLNRAMDDDTRED